MVPAHCPMASQAQFWISNDVCVRERESSSIDTEISGSLAIISKRKVQMVFQVALLRKGGRQCSTPVVVITDDNTQRKVQIDTSRSDWRKAEEITHVLKKSNEASIN